MQVSNVGSDVRTCSKPKRTFLQVQSEFQQLDATLAEIDTSYVDQELKELIQFHVDWIRQMRRMNGSPLDVASGSSADTNEGVSVLLLRIGEVQVALSERIERNLKSGPTGHCRCCDVSSTRLGPQVSDPEPPGQSLSSGVDRGVS